MATTIRLIGKGIRNGSKYAPIRYRAARLAAKARPKDYLGQAQHIFSDFVRRWRYVKDPLNAEMITIGPQNIYRETMGGDVGVGHGDCDDATVAIGAQLAAIGFPVRIATIAPRNAPPGRLMTHVFAQALIPNHGWVTVDPVVFPSHGFGYIPPHSRLVTYNLDGDIINQYGNFRGEDLDNQNQGDKTMYNQGLLGNIGDVNQWTDYAGLGDYTPDAEDLLDFRKVGIKDFGIYAESMGMLPNLGILAEVDTDEFGRAWTPVLELSPQDYNYVRAWGRPKHGMVALGDNGETYIYDGFSGFFSRIFKKIKKGVKKVASKMKAIAKKVISKIPGGKYLLKLGEKVWKVAKKLVRPLAKFVGKYAAKLAPIAAMIPGYGPAIAAGLYTAGKIANIMNKFDVAITGKKGQVRKLKFKSDKHAKAFGQALKRSAEALKQAKKKKGAVRTRRLATPPIMARRQAGGARRPANRAGQIAALRAQIKRLQSGSGARSARA